MIYKRIMAIARAANVSLNPSTYSSDLAKELEPPPAVAVPESPFEVAAAATSTLNKPASRTKTRTSTNVKPQHLRAYKLWREGHGLLDICIKLRSRANPLRESTVV